MIINCLNSFSVKNPNIEYLPLIILPLLGSIKSAEPYTLMPSASLAVVKFSYYTTMLLKPVVSIISRV